MSTPSNPWRNPSNIQEGKPATRQKSTKHCPTKAKREQNQKVERAINQEAKEHNNPQATTPNPMSTQESREERKGGP